VHLIAELREKKSTEKKKKSLQAKFYVDVGELKSL
jgi:hypothetical protein